MQRELADERGKERKEERANVFLDPHPDFDSPSDRAEIGDIAPRARGARAARPGAARRRPDRYIYAITQLEFDFELPRDVRVRRTATAD